jgi:hypothetical protein
MYKFIKERNVFHMYIKENQVSEQGNVYIQMGFLSKEEAMKGMRERIEKTEKRFETLAFTLAETRLEEEKSAKAWAEHYGINQ